MKKINKRKVAGLLAACVVSATLSPALPAYAETGNPISNGDPAQIIFNSGMGPYPNWYTDANVLITNHASSNITRGASANAGTDMITGPAGKTLKEIYPGLKTDSSDDGIYGANTRPDLPKYPGYLGETGALTDAWPGYQFAGWFTGENGTGTEIGKMPYAFADFDKTTFYAHWTGNPDPNIIKDFKVVHESQNTLPGGKIVFSSTSAKTEAAKTINAKPRRTGIPGYEFVEAAGFYDVSPTHLLNYSGAQVGELGTFAAGSANFTGTMPNVDATVTYRYRPNPARQFLLKVQYVDGSGNNVAPEVRNYYSAEQAIAAAVPITIPGYTYTRRYDIPDGDTDGTGTYSFTKAGKTVAADDVITGAMPNQPVTIQYEYELDTSYEIELDVTYKDNTGAVISSTIIDPTVYKPTVGQPAGTPVNGFYQVVFDVPALTSANGFSGNYYPVATMNGVTLGATAEIGNKVKVKIPSLPTSTDTLTVDVIYDLNATSWATVRVDAGPHGTISGDLSDRTYFVGTTGKSYPLNDLVGHITTQPGNNYTQDGEDTEWFIVGSTGALTEAPDPIMLTGDLRLRACFKRDPAKWHNVTFAAGNHGSITSLTLPLVEEGTLFSAISHPVATPDPGYQFDGWFDQNMNRMLGSEAITGDMTLRAIFSTIYSDPDYADLVRPDANGQIGNDGRGQIVINDSYPDRSYAVVNEDGEIIAIVNGNGGTVTVPDLNPSGVYEVYELDPAITSPNTPPALGSNINSVPDVVKSYPTMVVVPAVGDDNTDVQPDGGHAGKMQIVVDPTAPNTDYAIIDEDGNVVMYPASDADGWITPSGPQLIFDNLEPNKNYTVVARENGTTAKPDDKEGQGNIIYTDSGSQQSAQYVVQAINGTITSVGSVTVGDDIYLDAQENDTVRVKADLVDSNGNNFVKWQVVMGDIGMTPAPGVDSVNFTMPAEHVVLVAIYDVPQLGTASNADVSFRVVNGAGTVALDVSAEKIAQLREELTTAADEAILAAPNRTVRYEFLFKKRTPLASESNAIKEERSAPEETYKAAWAIDVDLRRYVDGAPRAVENGVDPGVFEVFVLIDQNHLGNDEYELWEITTAPDGSVSVNPVAMVPDPNTSPENRGMFKFEARIDATYVLSYSEIYQVKVKNVKTGRIDPFNVYRNTALDDNADYGTWKDTYQVIIDPDGKPWILKGLSKQENSWVPYDSSSDVKGDLTVYAHYEVDQSWLDARNDLENKIKEAESIKNGNISQEDKDRLEQAIRDAEDILNKAPTEQQMKDAQKDLQDIINDITGSNPSNPELQDAKDKLQDLINDAKDKLKDTSLSQSDRDKLENAIKDAEAILNNKPTLNDLNKGYDDLKTVLDSLGGGTVIPPVIPPYGGGSGSSGGGGGSSRPAGNSSRYPTYVVGTDGNWNLIDADNHKWVFTLNNGNNVSGTWAQLQYTYEGQTTTYWYHFAADGIMDSGWFKDTDGTWYYLSVEHDGWFGHMIKGWHHDREDGKWYYLDPTSGAMRTGWNQINNVWYFFNVVTPEYTWTYNESTKRWEYIGNVEVRPYGSMYAAETTPDNYQVDANGGWVR